MAVYRSKYARVAGKIETTPGTLNAPATTDANVLVEDVTVDPEVDVHKLNAAAAKLVRIGALAGKRFGRVTFKAPVQGSGTAGTAPKLGVFYQACGLNETIVASTSVTYAPLSSLDKTLSLDVYQDARRWRFVGVAGAVKFSGAVGKPIYAEFDLMGVFSALTDDAFSGAPTYETTDPPVWMGTAVSLFGTAVLVSAIAVDLGNTVAPEEDVASTYGIKRFFIADREGTFELDPEAVISATYANTLHGKLTANSQGALAFLAGATAGNIATFAGRVQITKVAPGDRGGLLIDKITGGLVSTDVDTEDQFSLALT